MKIGRILRSVDILDFFFGSIEILVIRGCFDDVF